MTRALTAAAIPRGRCRPVNVFTGCPPFGFVREPTRPLTFSVLRTRSEPLELMVTAVLAASAL